jgi:hypothetical protein
VSLFSLFGRAKDLSRRYRRFFGGRSYVVMMRTSVMEMSRSSIAKIRRCQFGSANSE